MNRIVIGVFGSELPIGEVLRELTEAGMDDERLHIIGPPSKDANAPTKTRLITDAEMGTARRELAGLNVHSQAIDFYVQSLQEGGSILAVEVNDEELNSVATMMQRAGASHVSGVDATSPMEEVTQRTARKVEETGDSVREGVENIWKDLKDAVQKVMS